MVKPARAVLLLCAGLLGACASAGTPAPAEFPEPIEIVTPDLAGTWDFTVVTPSGETAGEMVLQREGAAYKGTITPAGTNTLTVRSLTLNGLNADMTVDTPEGPVTFNGRVTTDGKGMDGIVHYHGGQDLPLTARKR